MFLAYDFFDAHRYDEAIDACKESLSIEFSETAVWVLARSLESNGAIGDAIAVLKKYLPSCKYQNRFIYHRIAKLSIREERWEDALEALLSLKKSCTDNHNTEKGDWKIDHQNALTWAYLKTSDTKMAVKEGREGLRRDPENLESMWTLLLALVKTANVFAIMEHLDDMLQALPYHGVWFVGGQRFQIAGTLSLASFCHDVCLQLANNDNLEQMEILQHPASCNFCSAKILTHASSATTT